MWQLVHAQGRENGGITASGPSHGSREIWSQVDHKPLVSRTNVPVCCLIPSFSLKSLKTWKENLEKTSRKPRGNLEETLRRRRGFEKALRRPSGFEKLPCRLIANRRLEMVSAHWFYQILRIFGKSPLSYLKCCIQVFLPELGPGLCQPPLFSGERGSCSWPG